MKKITALAIMGLVLFFGNASAEDGSMGFYVGADVDLAIGFGEGNSDVGFGFSVRPGYQVNEKFTAMLDIYNNIFSEDVGGVDTSSNYRGILAAVQYYIIENTYLRPEIGLGRVVTNIDTTLLGSTTSVKVKSDLGLAVALAAGYEFPVADNISVGPTTRLLYNRTSKSDLFNFTVGIEGQFRF